MLICLLIVCGSLYANVAEFSGRDYFQSLQSLKDLETRCSVFGSRGEGDIEELIWGFVCDKTERGLYPGIM